MKEVKEKRKRCLERCSRVPENVEWTEHCQARCGKRKVLKKGEEDNKVKKSKNKDRRRKEETKKEKKKETKKGNKVGPLETFIKYLFRS